MHVTHDLQIDFKSLMKTNFTGAYLVQSLYFK